MRAYTVLTMLLLLSEGWPGVVSGKKVHTVTEGEDVTAVCWFQFSGSTRIFCKNDCDEEEDILVETTEDRATNGRYGVRYEKNGFTSEDKMTVSIKKVLLSDSGRYWCKLDRLIDGYVEFEIKVNRAPPGPVVPPVITSRSTVRPTHSPGPCPDTTPSPGSGETSGTSAALLNDGHNSNSSGSLLYVGLTLAVIVVLFVVTVLMLYKKKNDKSKPEDCSINTGPAVPEMGSDREYEEVPEQQVQSRPPGDSDIYSLASAPVHAPVDTVQYSEVKFIRKSAPHRPEEAVVYSTVQKEEPLYSNVS